jgi:hypothetical protein
MWNNPPEQGSFLSEMGTLLGKEGRTAGEEKSLFRGYSYFLACR